MTYIARTRRWLNRSTVQWSHSSPGHIFYRQDTTMRDSACVFMCMLSVHKAGYTVSFIFTVSRLQTNQEQNPVGDQGLYGPLLPLASVQHTINTDSRQLADNSMRCNHWARTAKDRKWDKRGMASTSPPPPPWSSQVFHGEARSQV